MDAANGEAKKAAAFPTSSTNQTLWLGKECVLTDLPIFLCRYMCIYLHMHESETIPSTSQKNMFFKTSHVKKHNELNHVEFDNVLTSLQILL